MKKWRVEDFHHSSKYYMSIPKSIKSACNLATRFSNFISDPRDPRGRIHTFDSLIRPIVYGIGHGVCNFRKIETDTDIGMIGSGRIADNVFGHTFKKLDSSEVLEFLVRECKQMFRDHKFEKHEKARLNQVSFDGKWTKNQEKQERADSRLARRNRSVVRKTSCSILKAVLVSSTVRPVLWLTKVDPATNELGEFYDSFRKFMKSYGRTGMVDLVSMDALYGVASVANLCIKHKAHYLLAVKNEQRLLFQEVSQAVEQGKGSVEHAPRYEDRNGNWIYTELTCVEIENAAMVSLPGAKTVMRLKRFVQNKETMKRTEEIRYYVSSAGLKLMSPYNFLYAIRFHWGIEVSNWVANTIFDEYDKPLTKSENGMIVTSVIRALVYNFLSVLRARTLGKPRFGRTRVLSSWYRMIKLFEYHAFDETGIVKKIDYEEVSFA